MNRRTFLGTIGLSVAGTQLGCASNVGGGGFRTRRLSRVGIQLYSLRDDARKDLERTLADIASMGYRDVELLGSMNNFGMPAARLREVLNKNGLRAPSTHVSGKALDDLPRNLDEAQILGHEYVVVASLPIEGTRTLDDYRLWADKLNEAGRRARERGVWIGFHNHGNDMTLIDGVVPYDVLIQRTDPAFVRHQLDTGNTAMGGREPLEYVQKYGSRYWLFHIKDVPALGAKNDTELGKGSINFRQLLAAIENIDEKFLFVEQETYPGLPVDSLRRDYAYISTLDF